MLACQAGEAKFAQPTLTATSAYTHFHSLLVFEVIYGNLPSGVDASNLRVLLS
jgi:hypothetical protein